MDLRTSSDYFPTLYQVTGLYNKEIVYYAMRGEFFNKLYVNFIV
jgi:hypothetical protein